MFKPKSINLNMVSVEISYKYKDPVEHITAVGMTKNDVYRLGYHLFKRNSFISKQ